MWMGEVKQVEIGQILIEGAKTLAFPRPRTLQQFSQQR